MSLKFLIAVLNYLQEAFVKAGERHNERVNNLGAQINALKTEQKDQQASAQLAQRLAGKIDNLLSE